MHNCVKQNKVIITLAEGWLYTTCKVIYAIPYII